MQQEAGAPTCLGNSSTPGPSLEAWCSLGFSWSQGTASTITLNAAFPKGQARAGQGREGTPSSQLLGFSRRSPSSVTLGTGKGLALPLGVLFLVTMFKAE